MKIPLDKLEIHAVHGCNLSCESCSHFSPQAKGIVTIEQAIDWTTPWAKRLRPKEFRILGGEPTLHPQANEFIESMKRLWPESRIKLVTNGIRLKSLDPEVLRNVLVDVSIHFTDPAYYEDLRQWLQQHGIPHRFTNSVNHWTKRYHENPTKPFTDQNPEQAYVICPAKFCRQIFDGKLFKCSPITYIQLLDNPDESWKPYLDYKPLELTALDEEIVTFLESRSEPICSMCPATQLTFNKRDPRDANVRAKTTH